MKIYIKNISGETITLDDVTPDTSIFAIICRIWKRHYESQKEMQFKDFNKAIDLLHAGRALNKAYKL